MIFKLPDLQNAFRFFKDAVIQNVKKDMNSFGFYFYLSNTIVQATVNPLLTTFYVGFYAGRILYNAVFNHTEKAPNPNRSILLTLLCDGDADPKLNAFQKKVLKFFRNSDVMAADLLLCQSVLIGSAIFNAHYILAAAGLVALRGLVIMAQQNASLQNRESIYSQQSLSKILGKVKRMLVCPSMH